MQYKRLSVQGLHSRPKTKDSHKNVGGNNLSGRTVCDDAALLHCHHTVGMNASLIDVVQHDDDRLAIPIGDGAQRAHQRAGITHVEIVERLVEQQVASVHHGDKGALALAAG